MRSCGMPNASPKKRRNNGSSANGDTNVCTRARTYTLTTAGAAFLTIGANEYCAASREAGTSRRCAAAGAALAATSANTTSALQTLPARSLRQNAKVSPVRSLPPDAGDYTPQVVRIEGSGPVPS